MKFDNIEKEILEQIVDEVEDTIYGCGASCFEGVLETLEDDEEFNKLVDERAKSLLAEYEEEGEDEIDIDSVKEEAMYEVLSDKVKSVINKLRKEIKN